MASTNRRKVRTRARATREDQTQRPERGTRRPRAWWIGAAAVIIATIIAYSPALDAPFIFDDEASTQANVTIRQLWPPSVALHPPGGGLAVSGRPVANYSLAINYAINRALDVDQRGFPFGDKKTISYHVLNLLLHLGCGALLFGVLRRTFGSKQLDDWWNRHATPLAGVVAAIWLLHPIQTEAVDYIVQRTEILVSLFYLATLYAAIRAWNASNRRAEIGWRIAALATCLLGMGSKEVMITAPVMVMLYDRAFRRTSWRALFSSPADRWFYAALVATSAWGVALIMNAPRGSTAGFHSSVTWYAYLYTQAWAILHYLRLLVWPSGLTLDYGHTVLSGLGGIPGLVVLSALGAATIFAWTRPNRWGALGFLGAWFFLILAPSSSVVPILTEIAAERRIYLASAAVIVAVAAGVDLLRRRLTPRAARTIERWAPWVAGVAVIVLAMLTFRRSAQYAQPEILWQQVVERTPDNARAYTGYAHALVHQEPPRADEAIGLLRRAVALDSNYVVALHGLASLAIERGELVEARQLLARELVVRPGFRDAAARLGMVLVALDEPRQAMPYLAHVDLDELAESDPTGRVVFTLGTLYMTIGRWTDATRALRRALELNPLNGKAREMLGDALLRNGNVADAIAVLEAAVSAGRPSAYGLAMLSLAYASAGRTDESVDAANSAVAQGRDQPVVFATIARAMTAAHRPADADRFFAEAKRLEAAGRAR